MKILDSIVFEDLAARARESARGRQHLNLHESLDDPSQRLLIALEPRTYIRPHRHLADPKPECFLCLRGNLALFVFDDDGAIAKCLPLGPNDPAVGAELPAGTWHTVVCLEPSSILFETKRGPFHPIPDQDMAIWAPEEGSLEAVQYLEKLKAYLRHAKP